MLYIMFLENGFLYFKEEDTEKKMKQEFGETKGDKFEWPEVREKCIKQNYNTEKSKNLKKCDVDVIYFKGFWYFIFV